jgi:peptidoglycan/LPS O-acetylase OafA/YrhL
MEPISQSHDRLPSDGTGILRRNGAFRWVNGLRERSRSLNGPRPPRLEDILSRGKNNFDLIRLLAALTVIFGHSFYLFPTGGYHEPVTLLVQRNFSGTMAVGTFFFISGMLISQSFLRSNAPLRFVIMRIARIYPGSLACLLVTVYVLGSLATTLPMTVYVGDQQTTCYLRDNWSFFAPLAHCWTLPGVFADNHYAATPNGALWTLRPEIVCYTYVLAFGCIGCLRSPLRILAVLAGILVLHAVAPAWVPYFSDDHYTDVLKVGLFFIAGVTAFALRERLPIRLRYAAPMVVIAAMLQGTAVQEYALYTALFYCVLVMAASPKLHRFALPGDYSFGVYIYGFPIQQTVQHFLPNLTSYPSNLICLPLALIAGYFSWTFIERPTLQRAQTLARAAPNPFGFLIRGRPHAQDLSTVDDSVKDTRQ